jgi:hypothetical protein
MVIFGPLLVIVGIGFICWLLFTLAVFALPFFAGLTIGIWAFHTGAGVLGGIAVGLVAGGVTFGLGQLALAFMSRPPPSPATAPRTESPRWRCLHPPGRRSSLSSARLPSASRRSSASPEWPRPDPPDRAWRGADTIASTGRGGIRHSICPPSSSSNTK